MSPRTAERPRLSMPPPGKLRSRPEPEHWRHAAEVVPLVTAALFAAAAGSHALRLPWWMLPSGVLAAAVAALLATAMITAAGIPIAFAAAAGLLAVSWTVHAALTTPWSAASVFTLVIPAVGLGIFYPVIRGHHAHALAAARRDAEAARLASEARRWPDLLARLGAKGITVADQAETRSGHTYRLALPTSGKVTFATLEGLCDKLEAAARLRDGAIQFARGAHAGEVFMNVAENDILEQVIPYPSDLSDLTVCEPVPVGLMEDGTLTQLTLREICVLIVGLRGAGKSNLVNVLLAQLGRCVDVVIFCIDMKGGRAAMPWVRPWLEGRSPRPVIDWVATTRDEAERMLAALLAAIDTRSRSGEGGEKITPSAGMPAVILLVDELAIIFGEHTGPKSRSEGTTNRQLASMGTQIVQTGRSEAIDLIAATQRATVTMTGGGDFKSQFKIRIGLGVASQQDAASIIPDNSSVARVLARLQHPGSGILSDKAHPMVPVKFYRLEYKDVDAIAAEFGHRRPQPDDVLERALGEDYARRWDADRAGHLAGYSRAAARWADDKPLKNVDVSREFDAITEGFDVGVDEDQAAVHPARKRMLELLRAKGVMGMTPRAIEAQLDADLLGVARQTIMRWLKEELEAGHVEKGGYGRWKWKRP
jgi:DNA-binding transcriptional ArsR family regulator